MKKVIKSAILVSAMACALAGCGKKETSGLMDSIKESSKVANVTEANNNQESSVFSITVAGNEGGAQATTVAASTAAVVDDKAWGTKKATAVTLTIGSKNYEGTFTYGTDGSYNVRYKNGSYDYVYYYTANGALTKIESYEFSQANQDGKLTNVIYVVDGLTLKSDPMGIYYDGSSVLSQMLYATPTYDKNGVVTDKDKFAKTNVVDNSTFNPDTVPDITIARDTTGITSIKQEASINPKTDDNNYYYTETTFVNFNNYLFIRKFTTYPNQYDSVNRTTGKSNFEYGVRIALNSHNVPTEISRANNDDNVSGTITYKYDSYGFLSAVMNGDSVKASFKYTYDEGTSSNATTAAANATTAAATTAKK